MHRRGAHERLVRNRELDGIEDERPCLRPAQPTVERDQLLEGAAFVQIGS